MSLTALLVAGPMIAGTPAATSPPTDSTALHPLSADEIRAALAGRLATYSPPGSADAGAHEEFHTGGRWAGIRYGRGPSPFSGQWAIRGDQLCVHAEHGLQGARWGPRWFCRVVWRDARSGRILIDHVASEFGPLVLSIRPLAE
jgi:hypothetical protein